MAYLYPNLKSKAAFKRAIAAGDLITAEATGPMGHVPEDGKVNFEGPHYPKPHTYYGTATLKGGRVVKVT